MTLFAESCENETCCGSCGKGLTYFVLATVRLGPADCCVREGRRRCLGVCGLENYRSTAALEIARLQSQVYLSTRRYLLWMSIGYFNLLSGTGCLFFSLSSCRDAARVSSGMDNLARSLLEVYLAFEALTDHPYDFSSIAKGYFPKITSCDGCNKLATNNMTLEKFLKQRERQVIDMDLTACWLTLSMLSPMTFSKRLQFVHTTPMTFSRHNRKSNIFVLAARGSVGKNQDLEGFNFNALIDWVKRSKKSLLEALSGASMEELRTLYKDCAYTNGRRTTKTTQ